MVVLLNIKTQVTNIIIARLIVGKEIMASLGTEIRDAKTNEDADEKQLFHSRNKIKDSKFVISMSWNFRPSGNIWLQEEIERKSRKRKSPAYLQSL